MVRLYTLVWLSAFSKKSKPKILSLRKWLFLALLVYICLTKKPWSWWKQLILLKSVIDSGIFSLMIMFSSDSNNNNKPSPHIEYKKNHCYYFCLFYLIYFLLLQYRHRRFWLGQCVKQQGDESDPGNPHTPTKRCQTLYETVVRRVDQENTGMYSNKITKIKWRCFENCNQVSVRG